MKGGELIVYSWQHDATMSEKLDVTAEEIDYSIDYFNIDPISESEED